MPRQVAPPEVLDRLLDASGADRFELPPLAAPKEESAGALQKFIDWIMSFFPNRGPSAPGNWFGMLLWGIAILGALMIVIAIASTIYNALKKAKQRADDAKFGLRHGASDLPPKERLLTMLEEALKAGRTAEAARIRWKLFLVRKSLPGSVTPGETEGFGRYYPLMFGTTAGEAALRQFNDLDLSLRNKEAEGPAR